MDWLSIIIAILVFVLPAIFESDKKKKKRRKAAMPHPVEDPEMMEMPWPVEPMEDVRQEDDDRRAVQPESSAGDIQAPVPVTSSVPVAEPVRVEDSAFAGQLIRQSASDSDMTVPMEQSAPARTPGRRRRFNARDMVIYSEIMHPKYMEDYKKK